jgi:TnpA family transposase
VPVTRRNLVRGIKTGRTEWHIRYGGRGVMIYWHVEKKSACIYSQLKTCSSSEVGAMIQGLLRHCTDMKVKKNYVDTHGQNEIAYLISCTWKFECQFLD